MKHSTLFPGHCQISEMLTLRLLRALLSWIQIVTPFYPTTTSIRIKWPCKSCVVLSRFARYVFCNPHKSDPDASAISITWPLLDVWHRFVYQISYFVINISSSLKYYFICTINSRAHFMSLVVSLFLAFQRKGMVLVGWFKERRKLKHKVQRTSTETTGGLRDFSG